MMTEHLDQSLQAVFREAERELEGETITSEVMARTRNRLLFMAGGGATLALVVLLAGWLILSVPLLEFAILVSNVLTHPLFDLGQGWLGLVFLPVNNLASVLVLSTRVALTAWKKLTGSSLLR